MFYNVVPFVYALNFGDVPFILEEPSYNNPTNNPQVIFPRVFPATGTGGPSDVATPAGAEPEPEDAVLLQYNFTIERQQWKPASAPPISARPCARARSSTTTTRRCPTLSSM